MATHNDDKAIQILASVGQLCGRKMEGEKLFKLLLLNFIELHEKPYLYNDEDKMWDQRNV